MIERVRPEVEGPEVEAGRVGTLPEGRYLLFDAGCLSCQGIAASVERETQGWLTARGLGEPQVRAALSEARPGWKWEPTLLEVKAEKSLVFTGLSMKARMLVGLGPRKAARVAKIAAGRMDGFEIGLNPAPSDGESEGYSVEFIDRRAALKKMGAAGLAAAFLPLLPQGVLAQDAPAEGTSAEIEAAAQKRVRVTNMTNRQMMDRWRNDAVCQKIHRMMRNRGLRFDKGKGAWMKASWNGNTMAIMAMTYTSQSSYAFVAWKKIGRKITGCFSIVDRGGRAKEAGELDGIVGGEVSDVRMVENPEELRARMAEEIRSSGGDVSAAASSVTCNLCGLAVDQVIIFGCGTTAAIVAAATCGPGAILCSFITFAVQGAICGLLFYPVDRTQVCVGLGYC